MREGVIGLGMEIVSPNASLPARDPLPPIRLSLRWQILLACTLPVLLMLGNATIRSIALDRSLASADWVTHTNQVIGEAAALARTITDAQSDERAYRFTRDPKRLQAYRASTANVARMAAGLETLVSDNPPQQARARKIAALFERWRSELSEPAVGAAQPQPDLAGSDALISSIRSAVDEFVGIEHSLLVDRRTLATGTIAKARAIATFGTVFSVSVALGIALYLSYGVGSAIAELAAAADEVASGGLRRRANIARRDEIGRLAHSFNLMADALIERTRDSERIAGLGEEFQMCFTLDEAASALRRFAKGPFPNGAGAVFLTSPSRNILAKSFDWGTVGAETFPPQDCLALRKGHAHYVSSTIADALCAHSEALPPRSSACIPLIAHGETIGILHVESAVEEVEKLRRVFAGAVGEQLALTVANLRLLDKLQAQAIRDPLTGLFNRRYLEETLPRELARADRSGQTLGVFAIDVDHFKRFNDTFGHDAGDSVLRELGALLRSSFRSSDICARLGGEEFVVVLPDSDEEKLVRRAERLGEAVRSLALVHRDLPLGSVTISIGVAVFPDAGRTSEELLGIADAALYRAKNEGRNRAVVGHKSTEHLPLVTLPPGQR
jgi:diguanylate cyclase (GGDEF)-like protein